MLDEICGDLVFVDGHDGEVFDGGGDLGLVELAGTVVPTCVRVVLLSLKPTGLESVLVRSCHQTAIAARVAGPLVLWVALEQVSTPSMSPFEHQIRKFMTAQLFIRSLFVF